jgi:uncharacterized protein YqgV (UPF0045/DUF77 family)
MKINAAIQLLPIGAKENKYTLIDKAIDLIQNSGLNYKVCPFETVVEGTADAVYGLIKNIQAETLKHNCDELLINIKIHAANRDLSFSEKMEKY